MEDVERLLKGTVEELDRLLNAKNVLGDPIEKRGSTVIPIVSYGFGFGAGGSTGGKSGSGSGTGGGGGIKPLGAIIFDDKGARVEAVKGAITSLAEVLGETAARAVGSATAGRPGTGEPEKEG
ncbi:spore germination protein GerW family protein [Sulfitobacter sabulilitoris]|uniref:Sporulation protein YtfJ n=1 Tax=Sulfitobacter sabulilitoris TaxID=2562655 RepID=A0A5S3PIS9_9RHOB|nr:spore germination protein GerW family protein [Sulfitobacter sabulilitoris]TMM54288.1 sporulation protein YtfJ [Sulfitobacter sabulilitoris]